MIIMKTLSNAVIINGVSYTINQTEAKKVAELLGITPNTNTTTVEPKAPKSNTKSKKSKETEKPQPTKYFTVGALEQSGCYVRTIKDKFLSSKARYAIGMKAKEYGGVKLTKGDKVFDAYHKEDKYVQIYKFPTEKSAKDFMKSQVR